MKLAVLSGVAALFATSASAVTFSGVDFPLGEASFADRVTATTPGSTVATSPTSIDPENSIGPPDFDGAADTGSYSLGLGGSLTVKFLDNVLIGDGSADPDIAIFEVGGPEPVTVEISADGLDFLLVGEGAAKTLLDIDAAIALAGLDADTAFPFVRLTDIGPLLNTAFAGADIDAVGAISSRLTAIPAPASFGLLLGAVGLLGFASRTRKT